MAKVIINLTEGELRNLIKESVREVLRELVDIPSVDTEGIDISQIDDKVLQQAYRDLSLTPTSVSYDDILSSPVPLTETIGDILPPDNVVDNIIKKYNYPSQLIRKKEANHKISIYIVVADVGRNAELIEEDMKKMGYFLGHVDKRMDGSGHEFLVMQFEPSCQLQTDETENIKSQYDTLYHWTPEYCLQGVLTQGLVPSHKNNVFNYPPRTYLMKGDSDDRDMLGLGQMLCLTNKNSKNNGEYVLLAIDIKNLDDKVRFYYDPNSAIGIYTEQVIPSDKIRQINKQMFPTQLKRP